MSVLLLVSLNFVLAIYGLNTYSWGFDLNNSRYQPSGINKNNVDTLTPFWSTVLCGSVTSSPAVVDGIVYAGDFGGCLTALNNRTGGVIFQKTMTGDYGLPDRAISRNTPTYANGLLVVPMSARWGYVEYSMGSWLLAVNASNGDLVWKVQVSDYNRSVLTDSPTVENGRIYIGVTSTDEAEYALAKLQGRDFHSTFVGREFAYSLADGSKLWETPMVPSELAGSYPGAGIWSSMAPILGNYIYVSTGNLYEQAQASTDCYALTPTNASCVPRGVLYDSVVKLDKNTGAIVASFRASDTDVWNAICMFMGFLPGCPEGAGLDADFGQAPMLTTDSNGATYVAIGQKSGMFWLLKSTDLSVVWSKKIGPAGSGGGFQFGSSVTPDNQIFAASANYERQNHTMADGTVITYGSWIRLGLDGKIKWEVPSPTQDALQSPMTTTNNVVFASTAAGRLVAMSAQTGEILWFFNAGIKTVSGPAIDGDTIYWGTGPVINYVPGIYPVPCKLYAFKLARSS